MPTLTPSVIGFVTQNGGLYSRDTENNLKLGRNGSFFRSFAQFPYSELSLLDPNPIKIELEFNLSEKSGIPLDDDGMSIVLIITGEPDGVLSSSDSTVFSAIGTGVQFTTIPYNTSTGTKRIDLGETGLQVLQDSLDVEFDFPIGLKIIQERSGVVWTIDREDDVKLIITYESDEPEEPEEEEPEPEPETEEPEEPESEILVTRHNIHPENVLFIYNSNVSGSQNVAEYYQTRRKLPGSNIVGLNMPIPPPPSSCESPITKEQFTTTILEPIRNIITNLATGSNSFGSNSEGPDIKAIVLGYGTPLSYVEDDNEIIAIASRLHRVFYDYEPKKKNFIFDRKSFQFFGEEESEELFLTSVLDGPSESAVMKLIDRSIDVSRQIQITGKIMVDPYGLRSTNADLKYENDILNFVNNSANNLGLKINTTVFNNTTDVSFGIFKNESFYWGWFEPTFSKNLFLDQSEKRVFLYNADNDSACRIHQVFDDSPFDPNGSDPWCNISINIEPGYANCAGSVDAPGSDAFLRPRPFFEALHRGTSIAEAFLLSSPYVNWKTILIGDPLTTVIFPSDIPNELDPNNTLVSNNETIFRIKEAIETSLAWGARQARYTKWIREFNVDSDNIRESMPLLYAVAKWESRKEINTHYNLLTEPVQNLLSYIKNTTGKTFQNWLSSEQKLTTQLLNDLLVRLGSGSVTDDYIYPSGYWRYSFAYYHTTKTFENIHFRLQLSFAANVNNFGNSIEIDVNSYENIDGWRYESEINQFTQMSPDGFPSNFSGRRIMFTSLPEDYLTTTDIFSVRWMALDANGNPITDWNLDNKKIIIKN